MKGFKTVIFNAIMTGVMVLRLWLPEADLPETEDVIQGVDALNAGITFVWGLGNIILRAVTSTPIFKKE